VIQTNAVGDNVHTIDPATNKVVGTIEGIDVPPDGHLAGRIANHITEEPTRMMDVVDRRRSM
jgi:hypothetical protein